MMSEKAQAHADAMVDDNTRIRGRALAKKRHKVMTLSAELAAVIAMRKELLSKERTLQNELDILLGGW